VHVSLRANGRLQCATVASHHTLLCKSSVPDNEHCIRPAQVMTAQVVGMAEEVEKAAANPRREPTQTPISEGAKPSEEASRPARILSPQQQHVREQLSNCACGV